MNSEPTGFNRSPTSYGDPGFGAFLRHAFLASAGYDDIDMDRPIVGIADTSSDYVTCHRHMPEMVAAASRGVLQAGGLPMVFPSMGIGEILISPTSMLFRNMLAMETEELITAQPMDGVILVGGCDKTVPGHLMGAISADIPAVVLVAGPMTTGTWRGQRLGACTDCRSSWARHRTGELTASELAEINSQLCPTGGTCMVMGTASTMASVVEALGMAIPGSATAPSGSGDRLRIAATTGRTAVEMARDRRTPSSILSEGSFVNAARVLSAVGGSTNVIIHLIAAARRAGLPFGLDDIHDISAQTPLLVDCKPAGTGYIEDFHAAGGVPTLMKVLEDALDGSAINVIGETVAQTLRQIPPPGSWQTTIAPLDQPIGPAGSLVVLRGTLAPDGAVLKKAAASPQLLRHRGPALVIDGAENAAARIDALGAAITANHVLVVRGVGPVAAGMPEAGSVPIPRLLAKAGVKDIVRITDGRMSGTAFGTVILHAAPEAAVGGPLGLVEDDDIIEVDVSAGRLDLIVSKVELERRQARIEPHPLPRRGWRRLYADHVLQADEGADMDFLL